MSRVKETINMIDDVKLALIGKVDKPALYLIPVLCQIALSLAVIADEMSKDGEANENH